MAMQKNEEAHRGSTAPAPAQATLSTAPSTDGSLAEQEVGAAAKTESSGAAPETRKEESEREGQREARSDKGDKSAVDKDKGGDKDKGRGKRKNNVRKIRMEKMMSKAELARRAGMSTLTIDRVERGLPCRMDTKRKILEALGLKPSDRVMVFGEDD